MPYFIKKTPISGSMFDWAEVYLTETEYNDFKQTMTEVNQLFHHHVDYGHVKVEPYYENAYSSILDETICVVASEKYHVDIDEPVLPDRWKYWRERFTQEVSTDPIEFSID